MKHNVWDWLFLGVLIVLCFPRYSMGETAVFELLEPEWTYTALYPGFIDMPIQLATDVERVVDVRVHITGTSHDGGGSCYNIGGGFVHDNCSARIGISFTGAPELEGDLQLPGEGVEWDSDVELFAVQCTWDYNCRPSCITSPTTVDSWSFLNVGHTILELNQTDLTSCCSKCSATVDIARLAVEIDFDPVVAVDSSSWGALKSIYR